MRDFLPLKRFDHLELYVGNAVQMADYFQRVFGFAQTAYKGLETGSREEVSHLVEQGDVRLVLTAALVPDSPVARSCQLHGDSVAAIAVEVDDAEAAFVAATERGAEGALAPTSDEDEQGLYRESAIRLYGDLTMRFIERSAYRGAFKPGFQACASPAGGEGLRAIDHIAGNVELGAMDHWAEVLASALGFSKLVDFGRGDISTEYSALMSKVMQDSSGRIKLPINEPAAGRRKSQIQEYLDFHRGPGVQHIACSTDDIVATVGRLQEQGVEFLSVPEAYYRDLPTRLGDLELPVEQLQALGILVDRDEEGYLLQIFTKPMCDRPTLFFEIIERRGSRGFGQGNFKALFEAVEAEQAARGNL